MFAQGEGKQQNITFCILLKFVTLRIFVTFSSKCRYPMWPTEINTSHSTNGQQIQNFPVHTNLQCINTQAESCLLWVCLFSNVADGSTLFANDGTHKLGGHKHAQWNVGLQLWATTQRRWWLAWWATWCPSSPAAHCRGIREHRLIWYVAHLQCIAFHQETIQFLNCSKDRDERGLSMYVGECPAPSCFSDILQLQACFGHHLHLNTNLIP